MKILCKENAGEGKPLINLTFIGHVDVGKSTTIGHLLYKCGAIEKKTMERYEQQSKEMGQPSFRFSWVCNTRKEERERGITIENSLFSFETEKCNFNVIDTPGHRAFIKETIRGISLADCAILVVASSQGEFEAGMKLGQTKDHLLLAFSLGISQIIILINKMDDGSVNYSEERFNQVKDEISSFIKKVGYDPDKVSFIPISGWYGYNMMESSDKMRWWNGPTLLEALNCVEKPKRSEDPLRISIIQVYKTARNESIVVGKIEMGVLRLGMMITFAPSFKTSQVKSIEMNHKQIENAHPGEIVGIRVDGTDVRKGYVAGDPENNPPPRVVSFIAKIVILSHPSHIFRGFSPVFYFHSTTVTCKIQQIISKIDRKTGEVVEKEPKFIGKGDAALVKIIPSKPISCESYSEFPSMGRFVMIDSREITAIGIVMEAIKSGTPM